MPFWFHTFALNRAEGIYTPGAARDHRYRVSMLPEAFAGISVLDVGCFDGLRLPRLRRGAERVMAVDNEQYRLWVASRWASSWRAQRLGRNGDSYALALSGEVDWVRPRFGVSLPGGVGFRAIAGLIGSGVECRRMDALDVRELGERFDFVVCFGILAVRQFEPWASTARGAAVRSRATMERLRRDIGWRLSYVPRLIGHFRHRRQLGQSVGPALRSARERMRLSR